MIAESWGEPDSPIATAFLTSCIPEGPLEDVRCMARMMQAACAMETVLGDCNAINAVSLAHPLKDVQCPTLILQGRKDAICLSFEAQKLAAGTPNAERVILETANHVPRPGNAACEPFTEIPVGFLAR